MQLVTAVFLVVGVLNSLVVDALYLRADTFIRITRAQNTSLPDDTIRQIANFQVLVTWTLLVVVSVVLLVLAVGSLLRWRWAFWVNLAWLILSSIGLFTSLAALAARPATQAIPRAAIGLSILLSLAGLALLIWYIVALARFGPWAMRKPGP